MSHASNPVATTASTTTVDADPVPYVTALLAAGGSLADHIRDQLRYLAAAPHFDWCDPTRCTTGDPNLIVTHSGPVTAVTAHAVGTDQPTTVEVSADCVPDCDGSIGGPDSRPSVYLGIAGSVDLTPDQADALAAALTATAAQVRNGRRTTTDRQQYAAA